MRLIRFRRMRYTAMIAFIMATVLKVSAIADVPDNTGWVFLCIALIAGFGEFLYE
ncbi:MAG: hypothetical protein OQK82_09225 [Candidatus Pacearchaeota archaeon]|nr:hypothetical protein [Candidatus Pacearchaeota archaeon]